MKALLIFVIAVLVASSPCISQSDTLFINDFNDSSLLDETTGLTGVFSGRLNGSIGCGVDGSGLELEGTQFIHYPVELNEILDTNAFSISFYFRPTNRDAEIPQVLASHRKSEVRDSSFAIHYYGNTSELVIEFAEDESSIDELVAELDPDKCWYYITIVKTDDVAEVFVGSSKEDELTFRRPFAFAKNAALKIADSPQIGNDFIRYEGVIDDLIVRNEKLESLQLAALDYRVDQVISRDTTIFKGESVEIFLGSSCADNVQWNPTRSLSDPNGLMPIASPDTTTTYVIDLSYENCSTSDSIRIGIVGDDVSCLDLILPKAFTPNGDGLNDEYGISNIFLIEELVSFEIYDKWGSRMYSTSIKENMWDGTFNGQTLDPGMFLYKIRYICEGKESISTGAFSLIN